MSMTSRLLVSGSDFGKKKFPFGFIPNGSEISIAVPGDSMGNFHGFILVEFIVNIVSFESKEPAFEPKLIRPRIVARPLVKGYVEQF